MKKATTSLLFACAVIALVLASWWWLRSDDAAPLPIDPPSVPQANSNAASPAAAPANAAAPASASASEPERTAAVDAAAGSELTADGGHFYDVLVVDEVSRQPIAGADVWGVDEAVRNRYRTLPPPEYRALQREPDVLAERFGRTARSDANGRLRMFASRKGVSLHGRHGGRYGRLRIAGNAEMPTDGHRLVLVADETLRVIVRDAAGQPAADVPVDLRRRLADGSERDVVIGDDRDTDRDGMVVFPHVQLVRKAQDEGQGREPIAAVFVLVAIHGLPPIRAVFDASLPVPAEPVELQLPPCGALSVRLVLDGKPLPGVDTIALHAGPDDDTDTGNLEWNQPVDAGGWAHFPFVPVQPTLFVRGLGEAVLPALAVGGPAAPGLAVRHEVELADRAVVLRGRVLDLEGRPFAGQVVRHSYSTTLVSGSGPLQVDVDGRFLRVFAARIVDPGAEQEALLEKFELQAVDGGEAVQCQAEPRKLHVGVNDLGDLRLQAEPVVCAGRLVGYRPPAQGRVGVVVQCGRTHAEGVQWQAEYSFRALVADDGTFVVNGQAEQDRLRLLVVGAHLQPVAPVEFQLGQRGLAIPVVVGATWAIDASLSTGGDLDDLALMLRGGPADATVHVLPDDGMPFASLPDPRRARLERRNDETVRATWAGLPPGTYTLSVELPGHGAPLHQRPGIVLPMPADAQQPALDLREWMRWVQVELRHADGAPLPRQQWGIFPQPQAMTADAVWGGTGQFTARGQHLVGRSVLELLVTGDGFVPQRVAVEGDAVVAVLRPWPKLELAIAPGTEVPEGMQLVASLAPATAVPPEARCRYGGSSGRLESRLLPEVRDDRFVDGRTALPIGDGLHRLTLFLRLGNVGCPLARAVPGEVVAGGLVVVTIDVDDVRTAAERLRTMAGGEAPAGQPK